MGKVGIQEERCRIQLAGKPKMPPKVKQWWKRKQMVEASPTVRRSARPASSGSDLVLLLHPTAISSDCTYHIPLCYHQQFLIYHIPGTVCLSPRSLPALGQVALNLCCKHGSQPSRTFFSAMQLKNDVSTTDCGLYETQGMWVYACVDISVYIHVLVYI